MLRTLYSVIYSYIYVKRLTFAIIMLLRISCLAQIFTVKRRRYRNECKLFSYTNVCVSLDNIRISEYHISEFLYIITRLRTNEGRSHSAVR